MVWKQGHHLFDGRYIIKKKLGQGGFGITYLVEDNSGQLFALKTLKDEVMTNPDFEEYRGKYLRDFDREAIKLAICRHPHIVRIENHFNEGQLPCLVMEYIEGEDLWQRIKRGKNPLPEAEATRYIRQIGEALTVLHQRGLLHLDLKPQNIMLRTPANQQGSDEAVLIDFGIVREFRNLPRNRSSTMASISQKSSKIIDTLLKRQPKKIDTTQTQSVLVTPSFAPLEQYDDRLQRGAFTDVYALAATFYCLVTGQMPPAAFMRAVNDKLLPPQEVNPLIFVSDAASRAMLAGLQLKAEDRPQSVLEWLKLLQVDADELGSERGVDYQRLLDLLKAREWKEADYETAFCMLKAAGQQGKGYLDEKDIDNFPTTDLHTIDRLWLKYSNDRFGFSIQKQIYQELGGTKKYDAEIWRSFGDRVGWRRAGEWLEFDYLTVAASCGHFPLILFSHPGHDGQPASGGRHRVSLLSRADL